MRKFLLRRLILFPITVIIVAIFIFFLLRLAPGDPTLLVTGPHVSQEVYERTRQQLGLDQPLFVQFGIFIRDSLQGEFGRSFRSRIPVGDLIAQRLPNTIILGSLALVISYLIAIPMGILAGLKPNSYLDFLATSVALVGICVPSFFLGIGLIILFSVELGWFPASGYGNLKSLVLPAITLGIGGAALPARLLRTSMAEIMLEDYIRTARAKGIKEKVVVLKHALRNAMLPLVTLLGLQVGWIAAGSVVVEMVFYWPGIGRLLVESVTGRDYPVVQALLIVLSIFIIFGNLISDILYAVIDPRIRYE